MMFIPLMMFMSVILKNDAHFGVNDVNANHCEGKGRLLQQRQL
jgi:hypothetical protein